MSGNVKARILCVCRKVIPGRMRQKITYGIKKRQSRISQIQHREAFSKIQDGPITIVFLVYEPQSWNSLKSVFLAAVQHGRVKPYIIVSPENNQGIWRIKEEVFSFFRSEAADAISGYHDGKLFDISSLKPDIVFRQAPYNEAYPEEYSINRIARYAKTCYVPYGYNMSSDKHLKIENNHLFVKDLFAVFADCHTDFEYCEKLRKDLYPDLHVFYMGFPRIDLLRRIHDRRDRNKLTFTWIPRWSLDSVYNDPSGFFVYKDKLLSFFKSHSNCQLIIRPHPIMFQSFINWGVMSEEDVEEFKEMVNQIPNVKMDNHFDYLMTFEETDVLIADWSSLDYEFYLTGRPMIYCGSTLEYAREIETMMKLIYKVSNWNDMEFRLNMLISGRDELYEERKKDIQSIYAELPKNIGKAIINQCVEICTKQSIDK